MTNFTDQNTASFNREWCDVGDESVDEADAERGAEEARAAVEEELDALRADPAPHTNSRETARTLADTNVEPF